jgi:membrane peptidoglycan carboxypeptidase
MARWKKTLRKRRVYKRSILSSKDLIKSRRIVALTKLAFVGVILLFLASFVIFPLFAFNLPTPDKIVRREGFSTKILDRNGEVLYDIFAEQKRTPVPLDEMPLYLRQATIAIEDKNIY